MGERGVGNACGSGLQRRSGSGGAGGWAVAGIPGLVEALTGVVRANSGVVGAFPGAAGGISPAGRRREPCGGDGLRGGGCLQAGQRGASRRGGVPRKGGDDAPGRRNARSRCGEGLGRRGGSLRRRCGMRRRRGGMLSCGGGTLKEADGSPSGGGAAVGREIDARRHRGRTCAFGRGGDASEGGGRAAAQPGDARFRGCRSAERVEERAKRSTPSHTQAAAICDR